MRTCVIFLISILTVIALNTVSIGQVYIEGTSGSLPYNGSEGDEEKVDWSVNYQGLRVHVISVDEKNRRAFNIQGEGSKVFFKVLTGEMVLLGGTDSRLTLAPEVDSILLYGYWIHRNPNAAARQDSYVTWSKEKGIFAVGNGYIVEKATEQQRTETQPKNKNKVQADSQNNAVTQQEEIEAIRRAAAKKANQIGCRPVYAMWVVMPDKKFWSFQYGNNNSLSIAETASLDIVLTLQGGIVRDGNMLINLSDEPLKLGGVVLGKGEYALRRGTSLTLTKGEENVLPKLTPIVVKDIITAETDVVKIEASQELLAVIQNWDSNICFFTSLKKPLSTLKDLTQDEIACWEVELLPNILMFREAIGIPTDNKDLGVPVISIGTMSKIWELTPRGSDSPVRLFITWSRFAPNLEGAVRVDFVAESARLPETERPVTPFTVTSPKGGSVLAADQRTKEFLEKAFKAGFLFPNLQFPGMIDFDALALMSSDNQAIIKQYYPNGKLELKNIEGSKERAVYSIASPLLTTELSEESQQDSAGIALARAEILSLQGNSEEAYEVFEEVLNLGVDAETKARASIGIARVLDGDGRTKEAQKLYLQVSELTTNPDTRAMILIGQTGPLLQQRRLAEARTKIEEALSLADEPRTKATAMMTASGLDILQGNVQQGRKRFVAAGEMVETVIRGAEDDEKKAHLKLVLATIFMAQSRWNDVETTIAEAFDLTKNEETKCMILQFQGGIFSSRKQTEKARHTFEKALKLAPTPDHMAKCFTGLGEVAEYEGKHSEALANYDKALAKATSKETRSLALFKKGTVLIEHGNSQEAILCFEEVIRLTQSVHRKARSLANIGSALVSQGKLTEAQRKLEEALSFQLRPSVKKQIENLLQKFEQATRK